MYLLRMLFTDLEPRKILRPFSPHCRNYSILTIHSLCMTIATFSYQSLCCTAMPDWNVKTEYIWELS